MRGRLELTDDGNWMVRCRSHSCTVSAVSGSLTRTSDRFQDWLERVQGWTCSPVEGHLLWRCRRCSR